MLRRPMPAVRRRLFRWVSLSPEPAHTRKERRAIEHNAEAAAAVLKKPSRHNVRVGRRLVIPNTLKKSFQNDCDSARSRLSACHSREKLLALALISFQLRSAAILSP